MRWTLAVVILLLLVLVSCDSNPVKSDNEIADTLYISNIDTVYHYDTIKVFTKDTILEWHYRIDSVYFVDTTSSAPDTVFAFDSVYVFDSTITKDTIFSFDTTIIKDSTFSFDTVFSMDTIIRYDSTYHFDTVVVKDSVFSIDTVIVNAGINYYVKTGIFNVSDPSIRYSGGIWTITLNLPSEFNNDSLFAMLYLKTSSNGLWYSDASFWDGYTSLVGYNVNWVYVNDSDLELSNYYWKIVVVSPNN